jgi:hypothetical protein
MLDGVILFEVAEMARNFERKGDGVVEAVGGAHLYWAPFIKSLGFTELVS